MKERILHGHRKQTLLRPETRITNTIGLSLRNNGREMQTKLRTHQIDQTFVLSLSRLI